MIKLSHMIVAGLIVVIAGCGFGHKIHFDQPMPGQDGYWETAWIDPQIILSDSTFTLIWSQRVDSFWVAEPASTNGGKPSIRFSIDPNFCFASINLIDSRGNIVVPVVAQNLDRGHYKLTIGGSSIEPDPDKISTHYLKISTCGLVILEPVKLRAVPADFNPAQ